jgi:peptidoglycan/LPS O-acetylase OafA/YrhL
MFRRFMHLGPNLYIAILVALFVGCISHDPTLYMNFCEPCKSYWWLDYIFLANYTKMWFGTNCFNSTWTVSAQMQMYISGTLVTALYKYNPLYAFILSVILIAAVEAIRTKIILVYDFSEMDYSANAYSPVYCRADAYLMGMILWMM